MATGKTTARAETMASGDLKASWSKPRTEKPARMGMTCRATWVLERGKRKKRKR
ncbi:uncharacterized protein DS421_3g90950 [Arachis hypogaea]|nr:uncharacterized protein DS421_3g90950 [Arachis hypogaea]